MGKVNKTKLTTNANQPVAISGNAFNKATNEGQTQADVNAKFLTTEEMAQYLSVTTQTIRKYAKNASIPYKRIGRPYLFNLSDVLEKLRGSNLLDMLSV